MNGEQKRRFEDSALGKIVLSWPMIFGIATLIFSLGINMATLWDHTKHLSQIDQWHAEGQKDRKELSESVVKLTQLTQTMDARLVKIEDWRNGITDSYPRDRHAR